MPTETFSEEEERFLIESETAYQSQQQARWLQQAILGSMLLLIGLVIIGFGLLFILEVKQTDKIAAAVSQIPVTTVVPVQSPAGTPLEQAQQDLETPKAQTLRTQSLLLAELARQQTQAGYQTNSVLLALEALPKTIAQPNRPYLPEAETQLYGAVVQYLFREYQVLSGH